MDRTKLLAIALAGVACVGTITFLAGTANASTWHAYKGDIFAGHAYGLDVPAGARSYEITLAGGPTAAAHVAAYDPAGVKLGFYALSKDLTSANVIMPISGRHVLYVYDIAGDGALNIRVDADQAPALDLAKIQLSRQDIAIGEASAPDKLDKAFTATFTAAPVFVTLLYEGSAQDLNANVASPKGDVVLIAHETGTAFSPGVWSSLSGERSTLPQDLDGAAYTVTVHAAKFEGSMVLTALGLDLKTPPLPAHDPPTPPQATPVPLVPVSSSFALSPGKAIAFDAPAGKLTLADIKALAPKKSGNASSSRAEPYADAVSVYAPDDTLLKFVRIDAQHPTVELDLPAAGEYVAYVHVTPGAGGVLARLDTSAVAVREITLETTKQTFDVQPTFFGSDPGATFKLARAPVAMDLAFVDDTVAAVAYAVLSNEKGVVADAGDLAQVGPLAFPDGSSSNPANFAPGEHRLQTDGLAMGQITLSVTTFVRTTVVPAPAPVHATHEAPPAPERPPQPEPSAPAPFPGAPPMPY